MIQFRRLRQTESTLMTIRLAEVPAVTALGAPCVRISALGRPPNYPASCSRAVRAGRYHICYHEMKEN
jgi:hypothetical protein